MAASSNQILVSFVIPTLNSGDVLDACLKSIKVQLFSNSKYEIIISDGGSNDNTISIAQKYHCKVIDNKLKSAESGKALGIKQASGKYIALIDSDNILPSSKWLSKMLLPFKDKQVIGSEPWSYVYRKSGGFIERYSALTGVNDPQSLVSSNYDRKSYLRSNWNGLKIPVDNYRYYQSFNLNIPRLPSIGANGTIYRANYIQKRFKSKYFIDVDFFANINLQNYQFKFAKVKTGIIHSYCESSISKFFKKQNRRITDLYVYKNIRPNKLTKSPIISNIKFSLYVILIFPMLIDTIIGFIKKPDLAWLFHPLACLITLYIYAIGTIKYKLGILQPINRLHWSQ